MSKLIIESKFLNSDIYEFICKSKIRSSDKGLKIEGRKFSIFIQLSKMDLIYNKNGKFQIIPRWKIDKSFTRIFNHIIHT